MQLGKKIWAIPEGYIPGSSNGPAPAFTSHDAACILNAGDLDAHIELTIFFSDKEPVGPYHIIVPARRTKHIRFNILTEQNVIPVETDYASVFISDVPIVLQYTRLDSRQAANALLSTIAYTE